MPNLRQVSHLQERPRKSAPQVRDGGGTYVYRTRKPSSILGYIGMPWWAPIFITGCSISLIVWNGDGRAWWVGLLGLFTSGRHFAYVGETVSFRDRHGEHINGGGRWGRASAAWSDLDPVCVLRLPLPRNKTILRAVETLLILFTMPVYNEKKNKWNPRRITRPSARRMRRRRDRRSVKLNLPNVRIGHVFIIIVLIIAVNGVM